MTETEMVALSWGRFGVPVIFASGDDRLENDLETMPWIEFVRVKDASAALRPVEEARADLRAGSKPHAHRKESSRSRQLARAPSYP